jgi:hypothetical protein
MLEESPSTSKSRFFQNHEYSDEMSVWNASCLVPEKNVYLKLNGMHPVVYEKT